MSAPIEKKADDGGSIHRGRLMLLAIILVAAAIVASSDLAHDAIRTLTTRAAEIIREHPRSGATLFFVLSALSAMFAFFSSAVLLPVAIVAWGSPVTFLLLWLGWFAGGICAWLVGRHGGAALLEWLISAERVAYYRAHIVKRVTFSGVLLFHFAVPSEVPGYLLGIIGYPLRRYVVVLMLAELPFAAGAIFLSRSLVEGNAVMLIVIGGCGLILTALSIRHFEREAKRTRSTSDDSANARCSECQAGLEEQPELPVVRSAEPSRG